MGRRLPNVGFSKIALTLLFVVALIPVGLLVLFHNPNNGGGLSQEQVHGPGTKVKPVGNEIKYAWCPTGWFGAIASASPQTLTQLPSADREQLAKALLEADDDPARIVKGAGKGVGAWSVLWLGPENGYLVRNVPPQYQQFAHVKKVNGTWTAQDDTQVDGYGNPNGCATALRGKDELNISFTAPAVHASEKSFVAFIPQDIWCDIKLSGNPEIQYTPDAVVATFFVTKRNCTSEISGLDGKKPDLRTVVHLNQPLGNRAVLDGSSLPAQHVFQPQG